MGTYWYELVRQLQGVAELERSKQLEQRDVSGVLTKAVALARKDSDWNSSGLPESLQRALDLCDKQGPAAAAATALRLLDFQQIVEAKSGNSPKGSPKQGQHFLLQMCCSAAPPVGLLIHTFTATPCACADCYAGVTSESMTELHVPRSESQQADSLSRTSVPVITIKRSSEARAVPTTTTIVLQASSVQSNIAQRDDQSHAQADHTPHIQLLSAAKVGAMESAKLHVLKSKNGRSDGTSLRVSSKPLASANQKPSCAGREAQNGQHPVPVSDEATHLNSKAGPAAHAEQPAPAPMRAGSPPPSGAPPSTVTSSSPPRETDHAKYHLRDHLGDEAGVSQCHISFSPFQAEEAQSHEYQQLESRNSNSDSDKSCESAGDLP